ncbi:uncharacterized protein LOC141849150 [Brevipalpus obovatus]|uniref:uncharacterized protein LOC141849150 n=1 Tax=Brevipalpus obovatus TaxID=246614 RepID=UPI003D9F8C05
MIGHQLTTIWIKYLCLLVLQDVLTSVHWHIFPFMGLSTTRHFFTIFPSTMVDARICATKCFCDNSNLEAKCINQSLELFPNILNPALTKLFLQNNVISHLNEQLTVYQEIQYLDLSHNRISKIDDHSFLKSKKLKTLLLRGNQLTQLTTSTFTGLDSLESLYLSHNSLATIRNPIFSALKNLLTLDLTDNRLSYLSPDAFQGLTQLQTLLLRNNYLSLSFSSPPQTPSPTSSSSASLVSFHHSPSSMSPLLSASPSLPPLARYTSTSSSSRPRSSALQASKPLASGGSDVTSSTNNNNNHNNKDNHKNALGSGKISHHLRDALTPIHLRALVKLDLAGNNLSSITKDESPFYVDTRDHIGLPAFQSGHEMGGNNDHNNNNNNDSVNGDSNSIKGDGIWRKLTEISLENCSMNHIESNSFNGIERLTILKLSSNHFQQVPGEALHQFLHLQHLQMGSNPFTEINSTALSSLTRLKTLNISHCPLLKTIHPEAFSGLVDLKRIQMSSNFQLRHLDGKLFDSLVNLRELVLAHNSLKTLDPSMAKIGDQLEVLDVRGNPFTCNCSVQWIRKLFIRLRNSTLPKFDLRTRSSSRRSYPSHSNSVTSSNSETDSVTTTISTRGIQSAGGKMNLVKNLKNGIHPDISVSPSSSAYTIDSMIVTSTLPSELPSLARFSSSSSSSSSGSNNNNKNKFISDPMREDISIIVNSVTCIEPSPLRNRPLIDLDPDDIGCIQVESLAGIVIGLLIGCLIVAGVVVLCVVRWGTRLTNLIKGSTSGKRVPYPAKIGATMNHNRKIFGGVNTIPTNDLDYGPYSKPVECVMVPGLGMESTTIINNLNNPYEVVPLRGATRVGSDSSTYSYSYDGEYHYIRTTPITEL